MSDRQNFSVKSLLLSTAAALLLAASPVQAATEQPETSKEIVEKLKDLPTTLTGTYISAVVAQEEQDLFLAAHFYAQALAKQPDNPLLLERNFALTLAIGQHDVAFKLADRMAELNAKKEAERLVAEKKAQEEAAAKAKAAEKGAEEKDKTAPEKSAKSDKSDEESVKAKDAEQSDKPKTKEELEAEQAKAEAAKQAKLKAEKEEERRAQAEENSRRKVAPMVHLALGVKALKGKSYARAAKNFEDGLNELINNPADLVGGPAGMPVNMNSPRILSASAQYGPFAQISQSILRAWSLVGQDRKNLPQALKVMEDINRSEVSQFFFSLHSGLLASYAKDYKKAIGFLQQSMAGSPNSTQVAQALIGALLRDGQKEKAKEVLDTFLKTNVPLAEKAWMREQFGALEPVASFIRTPQQGAAELFTTLGDALAGEKAIEGGALYLQFADYLRPDEPRTKIALARLHEHMDRDAEALVYFDQVPENSTLYRDAQREAGFALSRLERNKDAIAKLVALLASNEDDLETASALARVYQADDKFQESIDVITKTLARIDTKRDIHWSFYFLRGSAYDQIKDWPNTERDMLSALELFPNQPTVLNYLGYSWVDRGVNLDKALEMIRQAVALRPYDGYFVDSLGWAYYRLEQFEDAVLHLERAVELRPEDPTITDHLGDAYWKVGRKNEAKFQWERVKTMSPKYDLLNQVLKKLEHGLIDKDEEKSQAKN